MQINFQTKRESLDPDDGIINGFTVWEKNRDLIKRWREGGGKEIFVNDFIIKKKYAKKYRMKI